MTLFLFVACMVLGALVGMLFSVVFEQNRRLERADSRLYTAEWRIDTLETLCVDDDDESSSSESSPSSSETSSSTSSSSVPSSH